VLLDWRKKDSSWSRADPVSSFRNFSVGESIDALDTVKKWCSHIRTQTLSQTRPVLTPRRPRVWTSS
jgi:hypothetical protein